MSSKQQEEFDGPCLCPECSAALANNFPFVETHHSHVEQEIIVVDIIPIQRNLARLLPEKPRFYSPCCSR